MGVWCRLHLVSIAHVAASVQVLTLSDLKSDFLVILLIAFFAVSVPQQAVVYSQLTTYRSEKRMPPFFGHKPD